MKKSFTSRRKKKGSRMTKWNLRNLRPDYQMIKLRTPFRGVINSSNGTVIFCFLNNLNKPMDGFGSMTDALGKYPNDMALWTPFWNFYCVLASKFKVTCYNMDATNVCTVNIYPAFTNFAPTPSGSWNPPYISSPYSKWKLLGTRDSGQARGTISNYITLHKFRGMKKDAITNGEDYAGSMLGPASPVIKDYWAFAVQRQDSGATTVAIAVEGVLTQYCKFFGRSDPL